MMLVALATLSISATGFAASAKVARDLEGVSREATVDVIVQFRTAPTERHHEKVTRLGGTLNRELPVIKGALPKRPSSLPFPGKYTDEESSGLNATVTTDETKNNFEFKLDPKER